MRWNASCEDGWWVPQLCHCCSPKLGGRWDEFGGLKGRWIVSKKNYLRLSTGSRYNASQNLSSMRLPLSWLLWLVCDYRLQFAYWLYILHDRHDSLCLHASLSRTAYIVPLLWMRAKRVRVQHPRWRRWESPFSGRQVWLARIGYC